MASSTDNLRCPFYRLCQALTWIVLATFCIDNDCFSNILWPQNLCQHAFVHLHKGWYCIVYSKFRNRYCPKNQTKQEQEYLGPGSLHILSGSHQRFDWDLDLPEGWNECLSPNVASQQTFDGVNEASLPPNVGRPTSATRRPHGPFQASNVTSIDKKMDQ